MSILHPKHKTAAVFLLLLIASGLISPDIASAGAWDYIKTVGCSVASAGTGIGPLCTSVPVGLGASKIGQAINGKLDDAAKGIFNSLVIGAGYILITITSFLASLAADLLKWITAEDFMKISITHITGPDANPIVAIGWPRVRDLANMFVVLGFVIVGIATTLRIQDYAAKKLLPKLIIAALLINFSLLICGIIIDGSNIAVKFFLRDGNFTSSKFIDTLSQQLSAISVSPLSTDVSQVMLLTAGLIFFNIMIFVVFILFAFLFLFRYLALWILVILSPLAFVCSVFPYTQRISSMWWSQFTQWCIIGIPGSFFIYLASKLTEGIVSQSNITVQGSSSGADAAVFLVPAAFLLIGFLLSLQTSAMGAGVAVKAFKTSGRWTGGAGKSIGMAGGRGVDKLFGGRISETGRKISSGTGRMMERMGLRETGATAMNSQAAVEKESKGLAAEYAAAKARGDTGTVARMQHKARTEKGTRGAAYMKVISDEGDLVDAFKGADGKVDMEGLNQRLSYSESIGAGNARKNAEKLHPELAKYNNQTTDKIKKDNPAWNKEQIEQEAVTQSVARRGRDDLLKWTPESITHATLGGMSQNQIDFLFERGTPAVQKKIEEFALPARGSPADRELADYRKNLTTAQQTKYSENIAFIQSQIGGTNTQNTTGNPPPTPPNTPTQSGGNNPPSPPSPPPSPSGPSQPTPIPSPNPTPVAPPIINPQSGPTGPMSPTASAKPRGKKQRTLKTWIAAPGAATVDLAKRAGKTAYNAGAGAVKKYQNAVEGVENASKKSGRKIANTGTMATGAARSIRKGYERVTEGLQDISRIRGMAKDIGGKISQKSPEEELTEKDIIQEESAPRQATTPEESKKNRPPQPTTSIPAPPPAQKGPDKYREPTT